MLIVCIGGGNNHIVRNSVINCISRGEKSPKVELNSLNIEDMREKLEKEIKVIK